MKTDVKININPLNHRFDCTVTRALELQPIPFTIAFAAVEEMYLQMLLARRESRQKVLTPT